MVGFASQDELSDDAVTNILQTSAIYSLRVDGSAGRSASALLPAGCRLTEPHVVFPQGRGTENLGDSHTDRCSGLEVTRQFHTPLIGQAFKS